MKLVKLFLKRKINLKNDFSFFCTLYIKKINRKFFTNSTKIKSLNYMKLIIIIYTST